MPKEIPITGFDWSEFHPSDHWPWEARCREFYGGWRYHVKIAWHYHRREQLRRFLVQPFFLVLCRLGKHDLVTVWSRAKGYRTFCNFCQYRRAALPDEEFDVPVPGEGKN